MNTSASNRLELIEKSKFANDNSTEIRTQLKALVDSGEIKLREISRFTTFEPSTISQALNNKYEGDVEKLDDALRRFYRNYVAKFAIIQTRVVVDIHETMQLAWKRREIALIRGPFGRGKSKAAHRFCALNDYAAFLELTSSTSSVSILHRIAEALGVEGQMSGSQDDKLHAIIRSLQRKPRLLIVDEADELKPRTLAILRDIHGEKTERCGIVLIATNRFDKLLQRPELGYLRRRITIKREVGEVTADEAKKIIDMWAPDLERDDYKKAYSYSVSHFGVASLVNLMMRAYDEMQMRNKKKIDSDCLDEAYSWIVD